MVGAFRDELEAARSRADALREQNEELREEIEELRGRQEKTAPASRPAPDPELSRLAERTLERLDSFNAELDAREDDAGPDVADPPPAHASPHPPRPHGAKHGDAVVVLAREPEPLELSSPRPSAEVAVELAALRAFRGRAGRWIGVAFLAGLAVGATLAGVLR
jgi:hypothetical protein